MSTGSPLESSSPTPTEAPASERVLSEEEVWARDWALRASLTTPADTVRGLFIRGTLEAIRQLGDEALVRRCLEACAHESFVDLFHYPVRLQFDVISVAMGALAERYGGTARALWQLGHQSGTDFLGSMSGRALLMLAGGEVKRLLINAPTGYRVSTSYGEHSVRWTGPASARWTMKRDFMPAPFQEGVLSAVLATARARNVRVVGRQTGPLDSEYDISWE